MDGIKKQMLVVEQAKNDKKGNVEKDRKEIAKSMAKYEQDKQKKKEAEEIKRIKIMEMMQQNIHNHRLNLEKKVKIDKATDHLLNPVTFQMMDQAEKMRDLHAKEKKLTDDVINKKTMFTRNIIQNQQRREDRKKGKTNEESFFQRLRRVDAQREIEERQQELNKR